MKNTTINNEMVLGGENMETERMSQQVIELEAHIAELENDNEMVLAEINKLEEELEQEITEHERVLIEKRIETLRKQFIEESVIDDLRNTLEELSNYEESIVYINTKKDLEPYHKFLKFSYKSVLSVIFEEEDVIDLTTKPLADGRYTKDATVIIGATVPKGKKKGAETLLKDYFAPFTKDFLTVTYKDKVRVRDVIYGLWVLHDGGNSKLFAPYKKIKGQVIFSDSQDNESKFTEEQLRAMGAKLYKMLSFTASGLRNATCLFMDVTNVDNRSNLLDRKGLKALSILQQEFDNKMNKELKANITIEKVNALYANQVVKKAQRFGQLQTASHNLGVAPTWALLEADFGLDAKEHDGMNFILNTFYAEGLSKKLSEACGYEIVVSPKAVLGELLQNRPAFMKSNGIVVDEDTMITMIEKYEDRGYDVSIYGNASEVPCVFVDRNSVKLNWDFETELDFHLLDVAKKSPAKLSIQMLTKAFFGVNRGEAKKVEGVSTEILKEQLTNRLIEELTEDNKNAFEYKPLTPGEFNNGFINDIIKMVDSDELAQNYTLRNSVMNHLTKGAANKLSKLKLNCKGINVKLIDDYTDMIEGDKSKKLIEYGEVYSPCYDITLRKAYKEYIKSYKATGKGEWSNPLVKMEVIVDRVTGKQMASFYIDTVMFKYPSVGMAECYRAKAICSFTIFNRIASRGYSSLCKNIFKHLTQGGVVVPSNTILMKKLAGMDFDFDGATLVADPIIVDACKHLPNYVIDIDC